MLVLKTLTKGLVVKKFAMLASVAILPLVTSGCVGSSTYGTGKTLGNNLQERLSGITGSRVKKGKESTREETIEKDDDPVKARTIVQYKGIAKDAVVVKTSLRRLYLGLGDGKAVRYKVGVGRSNKQWTGQRRIRSKRIKPAWSPTAQIKRDKPNIARVFAGGTPRNPRSCDW